VKGFALTVRVRRTLTSIERCWRPTLGASPCDRRALFAIVSLLAVAAPAPSPSPLWICGGDCCSPSYDGGAIVQAICVPPSILSRHASPAPKPSSTKKANFDDLHSTLNEIIKQQDFAAEYRRAQAEATARYMRAVCVQMGDAVPVQNSTFRTSFGMTMDAEAAKPYSVKMRGVPNGFPVMPDIGPWVLHCAHHDYRLTWERIP